MGLNMGKIIQHNNVRITHIKGETTLMTQKKQQQKTTFNF